MSEQQCFELYGKDRDTLIRLADKHTMTVQAWLASRSPKATRVSGNGIAISSTGLGVPLLNLALGCSLPNDAGDGEIDREIKVVVDYFEERNLPALWWMGLNPSPVDIDRHLKRNGISADSRKLPAMIAPVVSDAATPALDGAIQVWRAKTLFDLQAASTIRRKAFRFPEDEALHYFEDMATDWLGAKSPARLFLAGYQVDAPVAIGAVIVGAEIPGIYIMATLPDCVRQGFGKSILSQLLQHIRIEHSEKTMIVLTASRYGFPLYAQFGFRHLYDYSIYAL